MLKRYLADSVGNYLFFAPLVIGFTPALWDIGSASQYLLAAVPISFFGARVYTLFLKHAWYRLWGIEF